MHARTATAQTFDFGLQDTNQNLFDIDKYKYIAYGGPKGVQISQMVEDHWMEWVRIVDTAPWLQNWKRSKLISTHVDGVDGHGVTPFGQPVEAGHESFIAAALYAEAVWGFGLLGWLEPEKQNVHRPTMTRPYSEVFGSTSDKVVTNSALRTVWRLQGVRKPSVARAYLLDDKIYRDTGLIIPCEFGDLDRWLDRLV